MMKSDASHAHLAAQSVKAGQQIGGDQDPANMSQQHSVLNAFDFAAIDEMDPALGKTSSR